MQAAEAALHRAARRGVRLCLANPGTTEMPLVAALDATPELRAVLGLFEGVCTGAADGYARMTGLPALTILHLGPGLANGIANLHNARRANSPVVNLVGDQASWHRAADAPLTSDIETLARNVSRWLRTSESADRVPDDLDAAISAALLPAAGISTLILPADLQAADIRPELAQPAPAVKPQRTSADSVVAAADTLRAREGGVLFLGGSALREDALGQAARVAHASGTRLVAETFPARWERGGGLAKVERLPYFPEQAREFLASAPAVVLCGANEPVAFFGYEGQPSWVSPRERTSSLCPPEGDAEAALRDLADALDAPQSAPPPAQTAIPAAENGPLSVRPLGLTLAALLPEGAIVVDEAATSGLPFVMVGDGCPRHSLLTLTGGAIGQGLPCAVGAALACPDRKVVAFQADGSALYTFQALWTMARESLDVVVVLCSNRAYRILQVELGRTGIAEPGAKARALTSLEAPAIDWVSLARGCGVPATSAATREDFAAQLARALGEPGPRLIEAVLA